MNEQRFIAGTLWTRAVATTARARANGALQPIATTQVVVEDQGIPFLVRVLAGSSGHGALRAKEGNASSGAAPHFDPFLPYEPDLLVAHMPPAHVCLLNKFNVLDNHLLIVTRAFEEQEHAITTADFAALWACMAEIDGFAFYNAGPMAGASQRHKHLQLTPLPWGPGERRLPIEEALAVGELREQPQVRKWPYLHAAVALEPRWLEDPWGAGEPLQAQYKRLLAVFGFQADEQGLLGPYNLLCTRRWMMIVPRRVESYAGIAVNALGFAGSLLVRSEAQLVQLRELGVLAVLQGVASGA